MTDTCVVAYVGALHTGYVQFFKNYPGAALYVLGADFISEHKSLVRNMPALAPDIAVAMIKTLGIFSSVSILHPLNLNEVVGMRIVMPDEDVSRAMAKIYFSGALVTFDPSWRLRWDWGSATANRVPDCDTVVSVEEADRELMATAVGAAQRSSDWWRQVGALLSRDGKPILCAWNKHLPSEQAPYFFGDPRSCFEPGVMIDRSTALHAEVGVITQAARLGIKIEGCDMYVTTFPCPPCANAIAEARLTRLYYRDGYSLVDGANTIRAMGTKIIRVQ